MIPNGPRNVQLVMGNMDPWTVICVGYFFFLIILCALAYPFAYAFGLRYEWIVISIMGAGVIVYAFSSVHLYSIQKKGVNEE